MTDQEISPTTTIEPPTGETARDQVLAEAVDVIDQALGQMMQRELVSSGEVADLLLDLRTLLTAD